MPNPRIRDHWDPIIRQIAADNPRWSARRVHREIERRVAEGKLPSDYPALRTVIRSLSEPYDKEPYERFYWPESMEQGALPWEASRPLLNFLESQRLDNERPTILRARWYWRLFQAARDGETLGLDWLSAQLAAREVLGLGGDSFYRMVEGWLACGAGTDEGRARHAEAVERGMFPPFEPWDVPEGLPGASAEALAAARAQFDTERAKFEAAHEAAHYAELAAEEAAHDAERRTQ